MSRETISFNTLKSFIKLGQTAQNRQDGGLHGARSFKKAILLRGSVHSHPCAKISQGSLSPLFVLQTPSFTIYSSATEEGVFSSKQEKKKRQQKYCFVEFQLNVCLQKAFNFQNTLTQVDTCLRCHENMT